MLRSIFDGLHHIDPVKIRKLDGGVRLNGKLISIALLALATFAAGICIGAEPTKNIVDTIGADENFSSLSEAIQAADLGSTLSGQGNYTLFAPDDDAFFKIPPEDYKALLENTSELKSVLTFHVVEGKILLGDLKDGQELTTLQGEKLTVKLGPEYIMINDANITRPDMMASNGVIQVIDTVLMPK